MNNIYLREKSSIKKITAYYILALIPLILAGFYKNGIKLYFLDLVNIFGMFKPLLFSILGFCIGVLVNIIYEKAIKKNLLPINQLIFTSFHPLYGLLVGSIISINTNILLFALITFIILFISKFWKFSYLNIVAITALLIILIMNIIGGFTFNNIYEATNNLNLNGLDYLLGRGSGGINTTNVGLLIISLCLLWDKPFFKKEIPLYCTIIFSSCIIIYDIILGDFGNILNNIFANGTLFAFVFIATDPISSSYTLRGKVMYSIIIGIVTFLLFIIEPALAALGGITIASLFHLIFDKITNKA